MAGETSCATEVDARKKEVEEMHRIVKQGGDADVRETWYLEMPELMRGYYLDRDIIWTIASFRNALSFSGEFSQLIILLYGNTLQSRAAYSGRQGLVKTYNMYLSTCVPCP